MPKLKETSCQKQQRAFLGAYGRGLAENKLTVGELCDKANISRVTLNVYKRTGITSASVSNFVALAKALGWSGKEVCSMLGVPYQTKDD